MVELRHLTNFSLSATAFPIAFALDKIFRRSLSSASRLHFSTSSFSASVVYDIECLWRFMSASSFILSFLLRFFSVEAFTFFSQEQLHIWGRLIYSSLLGLAEFCTHKYQCGARKNNHTFSVVNKSLLTEVSTSKSLFTLNPLSIELCSCDNTSIIAQIYQKS